MFDALPKTISIVFAADVKEAGIKSPDEHGRVVDAHCLRYHFASELAASGCPVHILQKLMRHSTVDLSMRVYVHSTLDDLSGAVQRVKIGADVEMEKQAAEAAGNIPMQVTQEWTLEGTPADVKTLHFKSSNGIAGDFGGCDTKTVKQAEMPVNTGVLDGGRGGNRTRIPSRGTDFKSVVYAYSTTRPIVQFIIGTPCFMRVFADFWMTGTDTTLPVNTAIRCSSIASL